MKHIIAIILSLFILSSGYAQRLWIVPVPSDPNCNVVTETIDGHSVKSYYFKKIYNSDIINTPFTIYLTQLPYSSSDIVTVEIRSIIEHGADIVYSQQVTVGTGIQLNVNTSILGSGVYKVFLKKAGIPDLSFDDNLIITEKYITDEINGCKFEYVYVQNFFKVRPNKTVGTNTEMINTETAFISNIKNALRFAWNYQITRWKIGNLTKPYFTDPTYRIYISGTGDLANSNKILYHGYDDVVSYPEDNTRAIWFPVNAKRDMKATTTLDDNTFFNEVIGHEFFHGLQFSVMKYSKIIATHPTDAGAELDRRKWMIEGQARFIETVLMDSVRDSKGHNAAAKIKNYELKIMS